MFVIQSAYSERITAMLKQGGAYLERKLVEAPLSNFIAGRPMAALLF